MSSDRADNFALMSFYVEAGVDTLLADAPIDRFTAEGPSQPVERAIATVEVLEERDVRPTRPRIAAGGIPRFESAPPLEAPPAPDAAIMAAREAARSAASS